MRIKCCAQRPRANQLRTIVRIATKPSGRQITRTFNLRRELTRITTAFVKPARIFAYDESGNLTRAEVDSAKRRNFTYDALNRMARADWNITGYNLPSAQPRQRPQQRASCRKTRSGSMRAI
jgi:YD repeat-containing protein